MSTDVSFTAAFTALLRGRPTEVIGLGEGAIAVPAERWFGSADEDDQGILALCAGPTLDIGCGPGRMAFALAESGRITLGIDVVAEAVAQTRQRGASALQRDVFDSVPAEGRWCTVLLADGNIGIGGDPLALLRRVMRLLAPAGQIVVEIAEPGVAARSVWAVLEDRGSDGAGQRSRPFRWAVLGADDIRSVAACVGLQVESIHRFGQRWCAVLVHERSAP